MDSVRDHRGQEELLLKRMIDLQSIAQAISTVQVNKKTLCRHL